MRTKIVITDLTRMYLGNVCIAGYDAQKRCYRPELPPPGIPETFLYQEGKPIIFPFSIVELEFIRAKPEPPHMEDYLFDKSSLQFVRVVRDRESILQWSLFDNVSAIFEQEIRTRPGYYVMNCQGPRSLGTILPLDITLVKYEAYGDTDAWNYRLHFVDSEQMFFNLKINDLTWNYYCNSLRGGGSDQSAVAETMTAILKSRKVFLRVGLARGWERFPDRCYLQITSIYTFPDYLEGKNFADFKPR